MNSQSHDGKPSNTCRRWIRPKTAFFYFIEFQLISCILCNIITNEGHHEMADHAFVRRRVSMWSGMNKLET